jgi:large subunit ribosomal protein L1
MDKNSVTKAIEEVQEASKKRNFSQTYDIVVSLKNFDMKREKVDFFLDLNHSVGKPKKICALVAGELFDQSKETMDKTLHVDEFQKVANEKRGPRALAEQYDYFVAQGNIMAKVATSFGKILGSRGKMPNPKAGCVVPPNANLQQLKERLQRRIRVSAAKTPVIQIAIGNEAQNKDEVVDNIMTFYNSLLNHLPQRENNVKRIQLKLTMSKAVEVN